MSKNKVGQLSDEICALLELNTTTLTTVQEELLEHELSVARSALVARRAIRNITNIRKARSNQDSYCANNGHTSIREIVVSDDPLLLEIVEEANDEEFMDCDGYTPEEIGSWMDLLSRPGTYRGAVSNANGADEPAGQTS